MELRPESHLFAYEPSQERDVLPTAVYIKISRLGHVLCKIERMEEQEIAKMHAIVPKE